MIFMLLILYLLTLISCNINDNKGLSIDINYNLNGPLNNVKGITTGSIIDVKLPVPFVYITPSELENIHQVAEAALENEAIKAGTEDIYQEVLKKLSDLTPEEMINDLIAKINKLEAIKAQLGTEERIARLKLSNKNTTPNISLPVSHPVAFAYNQ